MACGIVPEVLNENNYTTWSMRLKTYLKAKDLWDVVQTEPPKASCPSDREQRSAEALHAIQLSCGDDILRFISDTASAKSAWDILQDKFDSTRKFFKDKTRHESDADDSYLKPLFDDVSRGDWNATKAFLDQHSEAIRKVYSARGETIIHRAIDAGHFDMVNKLMQMQSIGKEDLEITDGSGNTPLINAIFNARIEIVENMIEMNNNIVTKRAGSVGNKTPVLVALSYGFYEIARKLCVVTPVEELTGRSNEGHDGAELISLCFYTPTIDTLDIAWDLIHRCPRLIWTTNYSGQSPLYALASARSAFFCGVRVNFLQRWIYKYFCGVRLNFLQRWIYKYFCGVRLNFLQRWIYKLIHVKSAAAETSTPTNDLCLNVVENPQDDQGDQLGLIHSVVGLFRGLAKNLLKLLGVNHIYEMKSVHHRTLKILCLMREHIKFETQGQYMVVQKAIFRAVEQGQVDFIDHLFKNCASFIRIQDGKGKSVLAYAVECRQAKIYNLLYGMLSESDRTSLLRCADTFNNTILHSAANLSANLNHIQGAALQMQSELQWFKEVESIVSVMIPEIKNYTDRMTARELFTKNHKELVKEGEKSMKATATSCTVVGALIVTMMFAAAFTVPGGNTQDKGYPTFLGKKLFMVFIMSDSISLFFSTTSVMIFLGMLTSRYSEKDFLKSLPTKMIFGLFTLFFSIAAMMVAFSSALILMLDKQSWIVFPVILLATLPIASFVWMQFPLLVDTCISTYGPGKFDKK